MIPGLTGGDVKEEEEKVNEAAWLSWAASVRKWSLNLLLIFKFEMKLMRREAAAGGAEAPWCLEEPAGCSSAPSAFMSTYLTRTAFHLHPLFHVEDAQQSSLLHSAWWLFQDLMITLFWLQPCFYLLNMEFWFWAWAETNWALMCVYSSSWNNINNNIKNENKTTYFQLKT